jgi:hypothetical protein
MRVASAPRIAASGYARSPVAAAARAVASAVAVGLVARPTPAPGGWFELLAALRAALGCAKAWPLPRPPAQRPSAAAGLPPLFLAASKPVSGPAPRVRVGAAAAPPRPHSPTLPIFRPRLDRQQAKARLAGPRAAPDPGPGVGGRGARSSHQAPAPRRLPLPKATVLSAEAKSTTVSRAAAPVVRALRLPSAAFSPVALRIAPAGGRGLTAPGPVVRRSLPSRSETPPPAPRGLAKSLAQSDEVQNALYRALQDLLAVP